MNAPRIPCLVPFCRRTCSAEGGPVEWPDDAFICSIHWRAVPRSWRKLKRRLQRQLQRDPGNVAILDRYARVARRVSDRARSAGVSS